MGTRVPVLPPSDPRCVLFFGVASVSSSVTWGFWQTLLPPGAMQGSRHKPPVPGWEKLALWYPQPHFLTPGFSSCSLTLECSSCETLGKMQSLSVPQFPCS